jgi:iron(III) transport system substrate-binding protein
MKTLFMAAALIALGTTAALAADPLIVYSAGPKPLSSALAEGFTKKTGIEVQLFQSNSGKVMARYEAEKSNPQVDVIVSASWGDAITLDESGDLLAYTSPNAAKVPAWLKTGSYVAQGAAALALVYNTESGVTPPQQWSDLTKPEYKDLVTMPDPAESGSALSLVQGLVAKKGDAAWQMFADLHANGMILPGANAAALNPVLQNAKAAVFGAVDYIVLGQKAKGEKIEVVFPSEGTVLAPRPMMIVKTSKHAEVAKQFIDYMLSIEGQERVAKQLILPARTDVKALRPGYDELTIIEVDYVKDAKEAEAIRSRFKSVTGS